MNIVNFSEARKNFKSVLDTVANDQDEHELIDA